MTTLSLELTRRVLSGLILGEMLNWTNSYERSRLLPHWTRRKRRDLEAEHDVGGMLEQPLPFSLNVLSEPLYPAPSVKTEWFIWQLRQLADSVIGSAEHLQAWSTLYDAEIAARLSISEMSAVKNLKAGLLPPLSGRYNPHYFDDSACFRALAISCVVEDNLRDMVEVDASITHAEDGVWAARSVAVLVRSEGDAQEKVACASAELPEESWIGQTAHQMLAHVPASQSPLDLARRLTRDLKSYLYSYGNAAPETIPAALTILAYTGGRLDASLLCAQSMPRVAGSLVPLVAALCGSFKGGTVHEDTLTQTVSGVALPFLAQKTPEDYLTELRG